MTTALVIIDVQKSLVDEGIWESDNVISRLNQLSAKARSQGIPVVLIRDTRVQPHEELHHSLDSHPTDIEIVQGFRDAFIETRLDEVLRRCPCDERVCKS